MVIRGTVRAKQASEAATGEGNAKQVWLSHHRTKVIK